MPTFAIFSTFQSLLLQFTPPCLSQDFPLVLRGQVLASWALVVSFRSGQISSVTKECTLTWWSHKFRAQVNGHEATEKANRIKA